MAIGRAVLNRYPAFFTAVRISSLVIGLADVTLMIACRRERPFCLRAPCLRLRWIFLLEATVSLGPGSPPTTEFICSNRFSKMDRSRRRVFLSLENCLSASSFMDLWIRFFESYWQGETCALASDWHRTHTGALKHQCLPRFGGGATRCAGGEPVLKKRRDPAARIDSLLTV